MRISWVGLRVAKVVVSSLVSRFLTRFIAVIAISIDKLMLIITGIKLETDPVYLKKREYHAKDGIDDLIGFNANCI